MTERTPQEILDAMTASDPPQNSTDPPQNSEASPLETPPQESQARPVDVRHRRSDGEHLRFGSSNGKATLNNGLKVDQSPIARQAFKLDDELLVKIIDRIKAGAYKRVACQSVGITSNTLRRWQRTGEMVREKLIEDFGEDEAETFTADSECPWDEDEVHPNLWMCFRLMTAMEVAEAEAEVLMVGYVTKAARDNWLPAMTFLERKHPDRWKRRDLHEVAAAKKLEDMDEEQLLTPAAQEALDSALAIEAGESDL